MISRVIVIILDGVGVGALPDAELYGDEGSNTLQHIAQYSKNLHIPHLAKAGLSHIVPLPAPQLVSQKMPVGCYGTMAEKSPGKDTTSGHWELVGLILDTAFPTYPHGFPDTIIHQFQERIGTPVLGNKPASGTEIIQALGDEHVKTGYPIVYTSADSVFQIAAHASIIPLKKLYEFCRIARAMLVGNHAVGRVIARPFTGSSGNYTRTTNRKDFSLEPSGPTILDCLVSNGFEVAGIGKISDIFSGKSVTRSIPAKTNAEGIKALKHILSQGKEKGLVFCNLIDFDMLYGHRNDTDGFARALSYFDENLPVLYNALYKEDVLIITADHGCDPTTPSTDHSREYVPLLVMGKNIKTNVSLGVRSSFADVGATIVELFGLPSWPTGTSFSHKLI